MSSLQRLRSICALLAALCLGAPPPGLLAGAGDTPSGGCCPAGPAVPAPWDRVVERMRLSPEQVLVLSALREWCMQCPGEGRRSPAQHSPQQPRGCFRRGGQREPQQASASDSEVAARQGSSDGAGTAIDVPARLLASFVVMSAVVLSSAQLGEM